MRRLNPFEENFERSLKKLLDGARPKVLGAAVSGGADSVSLLLALTALRDANERGAANERKPKSGGGAAFPKIVAITVDHSIRPEEESAGDAAFVKNLCASLGVDCIVKKLERGEADRVALERSKGLEDAARFLRYQKFEEAAKESGAEFILLAHNQNDFLESLLMRFLQGSASGAASGIAARRGIYLRPLLQTSRAQIEEYLRSKKIEWRTDATNCDNSYLRNKIRNSLVPFLDENFNGWKKALLAGAEKAALEDEALEDFLGEKLQAQEAPNENPSQAQEAPAALGAEFSRSLFLSMPVALRQRLLYRALDSFGQETRVPYSFVREICAWPEKDFKNISAAGFEAHSKKDKVFIKKSQKEATESGFFDIIYGSEFLGEPFVLRSLAVGDAPSRAPGDAF